MNNIFQALESIMHFAWCLKVITFTVLLYLSIQMTPLTLCAVALQLDTTLWSLFKFFIPYQQERFLLTLPCLKSCNYIEDISNHLLLFFLQEVC